MCIEPIGMVIFTMFYTCMCIEHGECSVSLTSHTEIKSKYEKVYQFIMAIMVIPKFLYFIPFISSEFISSVKGYIDFWILAQSINKIITLGMFFSVACKNHMLQDFLLYSNIFLILLYSHN